MKLPDEDDEPDFDEDYDDDAPDPDFGDYDHEAREYAGEDEFYDEPDFDEDEPDDEDYGPA